MSSNAKLPDVKLGENPAIKLPAAGVQVGVKGYECALPNSLAVETVNVARTGLASISATMIRMPEEARPAFGVNLFI